MVESGRHVLGDGTIIEAGRLTANATPISVAFTESFPTRPAVLAQVNTVQGSPPVVVRQEGGTKSGVDFRLQGEENLPFTGEETIDWVVWGAGVVTLDGGLGDSGITGYNKDHFWKGAGVDAAVPYTPYDKAYLISLSTAEEADTASVRYRFNDEGKFQVRVEEEKSLDAEVEHAFEKVSFLVLPLGPFGLQPTAADSDADGLPDTWQQDKGLKDGAGQALVQDAGFWGDPDEDVVSTGEEYFALNSDPMDPYGFPGHLDWEVWEEPAGADLSLLTMSQAYLGEPDERMLVPISEGRLDYGSGYGSRLRGTISVPVTGHYHLYLSLDDAGELWLSENERKFRKRKIAEISAEFGAPMGGSRGYRKWDAYASQRSELFYLEAGQEYFLEALHIDDHASDHVSVGLQAQGSSEIVMLEGELLRSYKPDANDVDDDYLPDDWELTYGLNPADNGFVDSRQGERGDYDGDGLTNHEEYLLRTDPTKKDSDGDGYEDGIEALDLGSDPNLADVITGDVIQTQTGLAYYDANGDWVRVSTNGEIRAESRRGWIEYRFHVPSDGIWEYIIRGRAVGDVAPLEELTLRISINGYEAGVETLRSVQGNSSMVSGLTPWLRAGTHVLRIFHDNVVGRRQLQIDSIGIAYPSGVDIDGNGHPDHLERSLAKNAVSIPSSSFVSPMFIEGTHRIPGMIAVSGDGVGLDVHEWGDHRWYADIELSASNTRTAVSVDFEGGYSEVEEDVAWAKTNVLAGGSITIRHRDRLLLSAWPAGGPEHDSSASYTLFLNGEELVTGKTQGSTRSQRFFTKGANVVRADLVHEDGSTQSEELTVNVIGGKFPMEKAVSIYRTYNWTVLHIEPSLPIETGSDLQILSDEPREGGGRLLQVAAVEKGVRTMVARAWPNGPIFARGALYGTHVSGASESGDITYLEEYEDGSGVIRTSIVLADLPEGGYLEVSIFVSGITFLDGTREKTLRAEDFDETGVLYLYFNYPPGQATSVCHRTYGYDVAGKLIFSK
ncbi:MAG: hypothetical protein AAF191_15100 [Verrucomicrobiota bacterium]